MSASYCSDSEGWGPTSGTRIDVTLCFGNTILLALPSLLAILLFLMRAHGLYYNTTAFPPRLIPLHRTLYWASLVCMLTACVALVTRIVQVAQEIRSFFPTTLFGTSCLLVAWLLAVGLQFLENQITNRSSTYIFAYYVICIITSAINIRTMHELGLAGDPQFTSFCVFFGATCCGFIAEAWPRFSASSMQSDRHSTKAGAHNPSTTADWDQPTAYDQSNLFARLCFTFLDSIIVRGYRRPLQDEDVANMMPRHIRTEHSYNLVSRVWNRHLQKRTLSKKTPSLLWVVLKAGGWSWIPVILFALTESVMEYVQPVLLDVILNFIASYSTDQPQPTIFGIILAVGMFGAAILSSMASGQYFQSGTNLGIELKSGLISMIYRKSLKLSPGARREATVGEITNHMSVDAERIGQAIPFLPLTISAPFEVAVATWLLYRQMGPSAFTGLGVVLVLVPFQALIAKVLNAAKDKKLEAMDGRVRLLTAILSGIKAVKLYSWERSFQLKVEAYREKELKHLTTIGIALAFMMIMYSSLPSIMALLSFVVYALVGGPNGTKGVMSAQVIFVSLALFNRLAKPIGRASQIIGQSISLKVAVKRIQIYLLQEELDESQVEYQESPRYLQELGSDNSASGIGHNETHTVIQVQDGVFTWDASNEASSSATADEKPIKNTLRPTLSGINLSVHFGSLAVVVGRVGQGKSSLMSAIIGDMYKTKGSVRVYGRLAYVAQEAWIMNCTVKDNILFGRPLDQDRYERILEACSLLQDLQMLPAGDMTEIGERGINLSGGQKQRVSLARAAYQDADIYLLDDPLSAVDAHVDQHLWQNLIGPNGLLKNKTRLLITHGIHHLAEADQIVLIKDGMIVEQGQYADLMAARESFYQLIDEYSVSEKETQTPTEVEVIGNEKDAPATHRVQDESDIEPKQEAANSNAAGETLKEDDNADLIMKEEAAQGGVGWNVFKRYYKAATYLYSFLSILGFVFSQASQIGINLWLQNWASQEGSTQQPSVGRFLGVYSVFVGLYVLFDMGSNLVILVAAGVRAARIMHNSLLVNVLRLPMSFFDTTPVGRIVNRFSSDVDNVDEVLPFNISDFYYFITTVVGILIVISFSVPIFLAIIPFLVVLYVIFQILYMKSSRQLKRIHSISKSPLYQHFGETLAGVSTIRAMRVHDRFILENSIKSDRSANAYFIYTITNRWLHVRLEFLGAIIVLATSLLAVLGRRTIGADKAGVALSYALNTTFAITYLVTSYSELQNQLISVERINEYSTKNQEAPVIMDTDANLPPNWPAEGRIVFKNYSTRYRQGLDLVIKNVAFEVQPAEHVGVVGRTGAGKSSLTLALFRIIEAANSHWAKASHNGDDPINNDAIKPLETVGVEEDGGSIWIDGVDISTVGLEQLRQHLAIIPQDPTLFSGTVRENLDPFDQATDTELWEALERAHLKDYISSLAGGLSFEIAQNGENFSIGQRSLICLARALLRKTKVLVLDEATAAVDVETDELIQKTIREEFKDRTILTIAHRIKTIMDSDKILVLEKGRVEEYDTPHVLMKRQGLFYNLAKQAGQAL